MSDNRGRMEEDTYLDDEDDEDTMKNRYLTFHIAKEDYGIEIVYVTEIVGIQNITEVPDMPHFVKGVINLRGQVIPVIDMRLRFKIKERDYDERTCVIVVNIRETFVGLVVDRVEEVREIPENKVSPPPKVARSTHSRYIMGLGRVDNEVKILLDISKILFDEEFDAISGVE